MRSLLLCALGACTFLPAQTAAFTTYGSGCQRQRASVFENFPNGTFDLSGTIASPGGWSMIYLGQGWLVLPLLTAWRQPVAPNTITLTDDSVSLAQPLGFTMPMPSGSTSNVWIASNGFVYLEADTNSNCCSGDAAIMCAGTPRIAGCWMDLNPGSGGTITMDRSPEDGGVAWVTYTSVPEYAASGSVTFQVVFRPFGQIDVLYGPCSNLSHVAMAGYSPGRGSSNPGPMDLSALIQQTIVTGPDMDALQLSSTSRPRIGTTMSIAIAGVPTAAPFAWVALGSQSFPSGIDLGAAGMFYCSQYASFENAVGVVRSGSTATWSLAVPNQSGLLGQRAYVQALAVAPLVNSVGLITSNAAELFVGSL